MTFPVLKKYLSNLSRSPQAGTGIWVDAEGRAQGRYFNCTLTSAFQPIRLLDSARVAGFEAVARSYSESDAGLSLWKLLDHAANDDESIELDRLSRMLHAINFYRQPAAAHAELFLSVHDRLLAAVGGNHGSAFRRILDGLGIPSEKIILQLPQPTQDRGWLLTYVADNYRRNGFRIAVNTADASQALGLLERVRPDAIKIDARKMVDVAALSRLLVEARHLGIRVIFKRVENVKTVEILRHLGSVTVQNIHVQGHFWDMPHPSLHGFEIPDMASAGFAGVT